MKTRYFFSCFIIFFSCTKNNKTSQFLNIHSDVDYVGINTCKQCHMDIYSSFIETGMGKSFKNAKKKFSSSLFSHEIYDSILKFHYRPHWEGEKLVLDEYKSFSRSRAILIKLA